MEKIEIFISMAGTAMGLFIAAITFFAKFIKNTKLRKKAQNIIKISEAIIPYIKQAETFVNFTGEEKKEFVMTKANQFAISSDIAFDEKLVSDKIEELVELTKEVNKRESKTVKAENIQNNKIPEQSILNRIRLQNK